MTKRVLKYAGVMMGDGSIVTPEEAERRQAAMTPAKRRMLSLMEEQFARDAARLAGRTGRSHDE